MGEGVVTRVSVQPSGEAGVVGWEGVAEGYGVPACSGVEVPAPVPRHSRWA
nr:MAG TPA: hypothetical protein [Caudoviricetes sp.]